MLFKQTSVNTVLLVRARVLLQCDLRNNQYGKLNPTFQTALGLKINLLESA
jgi:hypothetical protein